MKNTCINIMSSKSLTPISESNTTICNKTSFRITNINLYLFVLFFILFKTNLFGQILSQNGNSKSTIENAKPSEINEGGLSGDVNVFTGTYNSSYSLGKVNNPNGLSYELQLSYNSVYAGGDNMPHVAGVPYGEGWNISMPTITVGTEDFNKFTTDENSLMLVDKIKVGGYNTPRFDNGTELSNEGDIYYYLPKLSIPGIASERMIYKYKIGTTYYFTLANFDKYIDITFDNSNTTWIVYLDNGVKYTFSKVIGNYRNPVNQRAYPFPSTSIEKIHLPKLEATTWYCSSINSKNNNDIINFKYDEFGLFDNFSMYNIYRNNNPTVYAKDIILKEVSSLHEKIVLDYKNISTSGGYNMISPTDPGATIIDPLYTKKSVKGWHGFGSTNDFANDWYRYLHGKSYNLDQPGSHTIIKSTNPYSFLGGPNLNLGYSFYRELIQAGELNANNQPAQGALFTVKNPNNSNQWKSGYLENKDRIPFSSMPAGELYNIVATVYTPSGSTTLLDINLATGQGNSSDITNLGNLDCYSKTFGQSVFSTFQSGLKWTVNSLASPNNNYYSISNFFTMPNLPVSYNGINIQIGPANSDLDYSKPENLIMSTNNSIPVPSQAYFSNQYQQNYSNGIYNYDTDKNYPLPKSGDPISNNFGIGMPWAQLKTFVENKCGVFPPAWFNTQPVLYYWPSKPTLVSGEIELTDVDIFRIAKNPYMLEKAKHYSKNELGTLVLDNVIAFNYEIQQVSYSTISKKVRNSFNNADYFTEPKSTRNVILLNGIRNLPVSETATYSANSLAPTIQFKYKLFNYQPSFETSGRYINSDGFVLEKIINTLGDEESLVYYPQASTVHGFGTLPLVYSNYSFMFNNTCYKPNWADYQESVQFSTCTPTNPRFISPSYNVSLYYLVQKKIKKDKNGINKEWSYTYQSSSMVDEHPPMSGNFLRDYVLNYKYGFGKTTVTGPFGEKTEYNHHTSKQLFGKINEIIVYDQNNVKVNRNKTIYKIQLAFEGAPYRTKIKSITDYNYLEYDMNHPIRTTSTSGNDLINYYNNVNSWLLTIDPPNPQNPHPDGYNLYYESRKFNTIHSSSGFEEYLNSFFVAIDTTLSVTYETCGDSIFNYTKYKYYDATHDGIPTNVDVFNKWLSSGYVSGRLKWEPSWQLASTYSYSPQLPDAYTLNEYFYLYDLVNSNAYLSNGNINTNFLILNTIKQGGYRNIIGEKRVTSKAWGEDPVTKATYYMYSTILKPVANLTPPNFIALDSICEQVIPASGNQNPLYFSNSTYKPIIPYNFITLKRFWDYDPLLYIPKKTSDVRNLVTNITYLSSGKIKKTELGFGLTNVLTTTFNYRAVDARIDYVTDPNNINISYEYDVYGRLFKTKRNGIDIQKVEYSNFSNDNTLNFKSRAAQNYVKMTNYIDATNSWYQTDFVDPLGRKVTSARNNTLQSDVVYDFAGRVTLSRTPYIGTVPSIDAPANTITEANFIYDAIPRNRVIKSSKFGLDINGTKVSTISYCNVIGNNSSCFNSTITGQSNISQYIQTLGIYSYKELTDEDLKKSRIYTNAFGQKVADQSRNTVNGVLLTTLYKYDSYGNVKQVSNPSSQISNYNYNYQNQLYQKTTPDAGTELYAYNYDGTLLAMKDANGKITVYTYDSFGRMLTQKNVTTPSNANFLFNNNGNPWLNSTTFDSDFNNLLTTNSIFEKIMYYDTYDVSSINRYSNNAKPYLQYSLSNTKGKLVQTVSYLGTQPIEYRWFSYNTDGFLKWEMNQFTEQSFLVSKGRLFRIDYPLYNRQGSPLIANVDFNGDHSLDGQYAYVYDGLNRLKSVWFNYDNSGSTSNGTPLTNGTKVLEYDYDDLKNKIIKKRYYANLRYSGVCPNYSNAQIDEFTYSYDQQFRLTDLSSSLNYFKWQLYYDGNNAPTANAYGATPSTSTNWNGNINSTMATYNLSGFSAISMNGPTTYHYTYDGINRLVKGDAGVNIQAFSPGFSNQADFGDESLIYDKIGNISSLTRGEIINGNLLQNVYSYSYFSATNRLQTVTNTAFGNRNITYDNNGNMLTDNKLQITGSTIGRANLTTSVTTASANIKYSYASDDNRIYKSVTQTVSATNQKEWYLRTGGGVDIGIFNISNNQFNWYVFGAERVAKVNHIPTLTFTTAAGDIGGNIYTSDPFIIPLTVGSNMPAPIADYYVYDHLGNTRVIFGVQLSCSNGTPTYLLRYAADYYPYGKVLREWTATTQEKYLYTQHERDKETGLDYAGARFYDSGLGRFTGVDPLAHMREWLSTYNYCQNNPINLIDPTGALDDDYLIRNNGEVVVKKTDDKFDRFYTESGQKTNGNMTIRTYSLAAQLDKNEDGLVKFPDNGTGFTSYGSVETGGFSTGVKKGIAFKENVGNGDSYLTPQAAAALFGVIHELSGLGITISLGDMSSSNGSDPANGGAGTFHHAGHGHMGKRSGLDIDFRYIGDDGNSFRGVMSDNRFNLNKNKAVYNAAFRFGFDPKNTYQGTTGSIQGVKTMGGHNNHGHLGLKRNPSNFINYKPYMP